MKKARREKRQNCAYYHVTEQIYLFRFGEKGEAFYREEVPKLTPAAEDGILVNEEAAARFTEYYRALSEEIRGALSAKIREKKPAGMAKVTSDFHTEVRKGVLCVHRQVYFRIGREILSEKSFTDCFSLPDLFLIR